MLVGGAAYVAAAPADRTSQSTAPAATDVKGPCDEAEHAADPRCAAPQVPEDNPNHVEHRDRNRAEDNHAARDNQVEDVGDDNPGEVEHHGNRDSGSINSGPGNAADRGGDGVTGDNNSGPGSDDSGHSGSGNSGSDDSGSDDSGSGGSGGSGRG
jgi:hypothetical protein